MNEFAKFEAAQPQPQEVLAELQAMLGMMHASGAMDEAGPFFTNLMRQVEKGTTSPAEALKHLRAKMASRNEYH